MTKYINNIKTIADFNYVDLELFDNNIKWEDAFKIEGVIKTAYTFDGDVTGALIICATQNVLGHRGEYKVIKNDHINGYCGHPAQSFHVTDKELNILFIVHVIKGINQLGQDINEFGIAI